MRIVFMGTPDFAVPSLTSLVEAGNEIALVVTRPDAVRGRGKKLEPSPVKAKALELGLPVIEANRMSSPNAAFGVFLVVFVLYFFRLPRLIFSVWLLMVAFCRMRFCIWRRLVL